jgi:Icc protein
MAWFHIIHISDLHVGKPDVSNRLVVLEKEIANRLNDRTVNPEVAPRVLVVTGDLVDTPERAALEAARDWINRVSHHFQHILVIPGNHDYRVRGLGRLDRKPFDTIIDKNRDALLIPKFGLHVIPIDSTPAYLAKGVITNEAFDSMTASVQASATLESLSGDERDVLVRILAVHHHPLPLAEGESSKLINVTIAGAGMRAFDTETLMFLKNPARLLNACMASSVKLILHGHRHVTGLARYSVPSASSQSYTEWNDLVVLSCPSSTGIDYSAGFNEVMAHPREGLTIRRWVRPDNAGNFIRQDLNLRDGWLTVAHSLESFDIAAQVEYELGVPSLTVRERIASATKLFRRRAFDPHEKLESWDLYAYAIPKTRLVWEQHIVGSFRAKKSNTHAHMVAQVLNEMVDHICNDVYQYDREDFDELCARYLGHKREFLNQLPHEQSLPIAIANRAQLLDRLYAALPGTGIRIG